MLRRVPIVVDDPHSTPLRFLSETGLVGFLLYVGTAAGALWGHGARVSTRQGRARDRGCGVFVHSLVDKDWNYVAGCGPLLLARRRARGAPAGARRRNRLGAPPASRRCALAVALAGIYSLAAPWLADRALAAMRTGRRRTRTTR